MKIAYVLSVAAFTACLSTSAMADGGFVAGIGGAHNGWTSGWAAGSAGASTGVGSVETSNFNKVEAVAKVDAEGAFAGSFAGSQQNAEASGGWGVGAYSTGGVSLTTRGSGAAGAFVK